MYNARKNPISAKNVRGNDSGYSKSCKSNCSCPNNIQFKKDQSKCDNQFHNNNNSLKKVAEESEKFLLDELKKYGLAPKTKKVAETKHFNSPRPVGRADINLKSIKEDRIVKVDIKENSCKNKFKSKTEPNLSNERYVEDLKKEIKSKKREIPSLPEKYKKKYLRSLKEELRLNKLTAHHENNQQIEDIKKEIENFRAHNTPFLQSDGQSSLKNNFHPTEYEITLQHQDQEPKDLLKHGIDRARHNKKLKKGKNSEAGDGYDR